MTPNSGYLRITELINSGGKPSAQSWSSVLIGHKNKEERSKSRTEVSADKVHLEET